MNPQCKTSYAVKKLSMSQKFQAKEDVIDKLSKELGSPVKEIGYISPGHGLRGKHNPISTDQYVLKMYNEYRSKRCEIHLGCLCLTNENSVSSSERDQGRKLNHEGEETELLAPSVKRGTCQQQIQQVEDIVEKLREKHGKKFSVEKVNAWAHMINMGKHSSYDAPPNFPYFDKHFQTEHPSTLSRKTHSAV